MFLTSLFDLQWLIDNTTPKAPMLNLKMKLTREQSPTRSGSWAILFNADLIIASVSEWQRWRRGLGSSSFFYKNDKKYSMITGLDKQNFEHKILSLFLHISFNI